MFQDGLQSNRSVHPIIGRVKTRFFLREAEIRKALCDQPGLQQTAVRTRPPPPTFSAVNFPPGRFLPDRVAKVIAYYDPDIITLQGIRGGLKPHRSGLMFLTSQVAITYNHISSSINHPSCLNAFIVISGKGSDPVRRWAG